MTDSKQHSVSNHHIGFCPHEHKCLELLQAEKRAVDYQAVAEQRDVLQEQLESEHERAEAYARLIDTVTGERDAAVEQYETAQRILVEERRWIADARDWYRDHRSSKGGIYDEGTWGDPFAVPGEAGVSASSDSVGRAERPATPPVSSPVSSPARDSS